MSKNLKEVTFITNSICSHGCGHEFLKPNVPLGTKYRIDPKTAKMGRLKCGGCKKETRVTLVRAIRDGGRWGWLAAEIFDDADLIAT